AYPQPLRHPVRRAQYLGRYRVYTSEPVRTGISEMNDRASPGNTTVRYWHLADIDADAEHVRFLGVKRTSRIHHKTGESPIQPEGIPSSPVVIQCQAKEWHRVGRRGSELV